MQPINPRCALLAQTACLIAAGPITMLELADLADVIHLIISARARLRTAL